MVKAVYENNVLKPLEKLNLKDGMVMEVEITESNADRIVGLLGDVDMDLVDIQHAAKDIWAKKAELDG